MIKSKEKGVTLIALVTTIVVILILSSIGITAGTSTIKLVNFSQFKNELNILQTKINELNEDNELKIGQELPELSVEEKSILNKSEISDIIYKNVSENEKIKIQQSFKFYSNTYLQDKLNLEGIKRDYLINIEYRYVICCSGFDYNGIIYYMIDQIESEAYNVRFKEKNSKEEKVKFVVNEPIKEQDRWKIEVSNIQYTGYINNWQVRYRLEEDSYWTNANGLTFYVTKEGNYYVQVIHNEIDSEPQLVNIQEDVSNIVEETVHEN